MRKLLLVCVVLGLPGVSAAFEAQENISLDACDGLSIGPELDCVQSAIASCEELGNASDATTPELSACSGAALAHSDKRLNATYKTLLSAARKNSDSENSEMARSETVLRSAQRHWIEYRDAMCDVRVIWGAINSDRSGAVFNCQTLLTIQQIHVLEREVGSYVR